MGLKVANVAEYENAIRNLFPRGAWWDAQFADPQSDLSLFAKAKADGIALFRRRMGALLNEGRIETADETIADWERVVLGAVSHGKTLAERRAALRAMESDRLNRAALDECAERHGLVLREVAIPFRPRCFGHARFAQDRIAAFAGFSVVLFRCADPDFSGYWDEVKNGLLKQDSHKCASAMIAWCTSRSTKCARLYSAN